MNKSMKTILPLAAFAGLALTANAAVIHSFNMTTALGAVDVSDNATGISITGATDWTAITVASGTGTNNGATLTFDSSNGWGGTVGNRGTVGAAAIRIHGGITTGDIPWTITGLANNGVYDMVWYNKNTGETRHPNTGVAGFDAGNGIGLSGVRDSEGDQNFSSVQADGSGTITGTWFYDGNLTAVAGVQLIAVPEPTTTALLGLGGLALILRRRK